MTFKEQLNEDINVAAKKFVATHPFNTTETTETLELLMRIAMKEGAILALETVKEIFNAT